MKKVAFLFLLAILVGTSCSVKEVRQAERELGRENLPGALENIQLAMEMEEVQEDPEAWLLKSNILMAIENSQNPEYHALVENPLESAREYINKAEELDEDNSYILDIQQAKLMLSESFFNSGAIAYNEERHSEASTLFLNSYEVSLEFESIDTATLYNAGLAAEIAQEFDKAYEIYTQVEEYEYDQPYLYSSLANIAVFKEEMDQAVEWITKGREKYPENLDLIFAEANVYLTAGNIPEARRVLELAIEKDPENANLHYAFAVNYDQMSKDTLYTKEEREFAYQEAIKAYEKAIELEPDYFDAIYNLGALYFNEGIQYFLQADEVLRDGYTQENLRKAEELEKKSKEIWREDAQPYLEQAKQLTDEDDPNYEIVLRSLRELYMRTNQREELEELNEIWQRIFDEEIDEDFQPE